ncbi:MAG TPA: hypothetical protein VHA56_13970 [Mucilaginibacter sp.]|nr:hypothetical protein [Mucilaginibacter sp.]
MNRQTIERQPSVEQVLAEEQKALRDIQLLRESQEMEGLNDRVLQFEESGGIRIVSYNEYEKETLLRDPEGNEHVDVEEITVDEKSDLDAMYEIVSEYEDIETQSISEFEDERDLEDGFFRDDIADNERDDIDIEYDD